MSLIVKLTLAVAFVLGTLALDADRAEAQARVIELEDEIIKGRVQKPEAFYILQHAALNYKRLDAKETFIPELLNTVNEKVFVKQ